ncbi:helix-turn-helix domain-containing protein [Lysobacter sp. 5GHs7-4]|uniref:helix-turn-helix domain-containing protein n=1 Tax=Lysobacter sp. 5GHs7-4 TaxID=2904253 RepID=UPI001E46A62A|nr:helix-turn-helix transcriptional regulator [Lysobacter sp. 5GHs7-4]UHQ23069.1 helix-turn-helix domain-containing protein [Lysobacter sp. 5GHs7-4]
MKRKDTVSDDSFVLGSDNVFADLGLPNPEEHLTKASLAYRLNERIDSLGSSQQEIAGRLEISQPNVSLLRNYKLQGFSVERLLQFLVKLGLQVTISVGEKPTANACLRVVCRVDEYLLPKSSIPKTGTYSAWMLGAEGSSRVGDRTHHTTVPTFSVPPADAESIRVHSSFGLTSGRQLQ